MTTDLRNARTAPPVSADGSGADVSGAAKLQLKIGGMACSFCANSITKALERQDGVRRVSVNLAHEEALIAYDPLRVRPAMLEHTLRQIGFTVRPSDRDAAFAEDEAYLKEQRSNLIVAAGFVTAAAAAMALMWLDLLLPAGAAGLY